MKKIYFIAITVTVIIAIGGIGIMCIPQRTPERILQKIPIKKFGVNIQELHPEVISFDEQWCPNGDGYCSIIFRYENNDEVIKNFKHLPLDEKEKGILLGNKSFKEAMHGYYLLNILNYNYWRDATSPRDFCILVLDADTNEGILHYSYF